MRIPTLLTLIISFTFLQAASIEEAPMYYSGRYRPVEAQKDTPLSELHLLPSKQNTSQWLPLSTLSQRDHNFTPYDQKSFEQIRAAYLTQAANLPDLLITAYKQIEGKTYLASAKRNLKFPTYSQVKTEYYYLHYPWIQTCFVLFFLSTALFLIRSRWAYTCSTISFFLLTLIIALRIYILERPPVANMAETLLFVPWLGMAFSLFVKREALPAAALLSTVLLGAAWYSNIQTSLENVQAVLDSNYWLTIHVLLVVGSYAFFLLAGLLGHAYFIAMIQNKNNLADSIANKIQMSAYSGLAMLIPGTILGGIWAAQSWGRFWDWDPKESWAFITICAYLICVHAYRYRLIGDYGLAWASVIGAWTVTFTWYGVNYILGTGLHSYGFGNGGEKIYLGILFLDVVLCLILAIAARKSVKFG